MALDGVVDLIEVVARFFGRIFSEVLVEFLCKGVGYFICRNFKRDINPDGFVVFIVGFLFWAVVLVVSFAVYDFLVNQIEIDKCLDNGGKFNHQTRECVFG